MTNCYYSSVIKKSLVKVTEMDQELVDIFIEEVGQLKNELIPILEELKKNNQQPDLFNSFAQIVDRIYGTATTMGFTSIGEYLGAVRNISRKAVTAKSPRGLQEVFKILRTCNEYFELMQESLSCDVAAKELSLKLKLEIKKMEKMEKEIFSFSRDAKTMLT